MKMTLRKTVLTERESLALRLRDDEGMTLAKVAECLGVTRERARQLLRGVRERLAEHEERGSNAFTLLPGRVANFLRNFEIQNREEAREAIESGRIYWGKPTDGWGGEGLCVDGHGTRHAGWDSWVILCEWTGKPKPRRKPKKKRPGIGF